MFPPHMRRVPVRSKAVAQRSESVNEAQQLLLPLIVAFFLAAVLAWPSHVRAQGAVSVTATSDGTHQVRAGETLWSLAARYYGDGSMWRDLAALNGLSEGGERGIAVGQLLKVPTETPSLAKARAAMAEAPPAQTPASAVIPAAAEVSAAPATAAVPAPHKPSTAYAAKTVVEPEAPVEHPGAELIQLPAPPPAPAENPDIPRPPVRIGLVGISDLQAARGRDNATVFIGPEPFNIDTMQGTVYLNGGESFVAPAGRRRGEFEAAPFPMSAEQWKSAGVVMGRASSGVATKSREAARMQQRDLVEIALPVDHSGAIGERLVVVSSGTTFSNGVRLALPSGIFTIEAPKNGVTVARVTRLYGVVMEGQQLVAYVEAPTTQMIDDVAPIETTVRWVTERPLLPSLESYLMLDNSTGALEVGDRFELISDPKTMSRAAMVRVVRVSEHGAIAIVMQQAQPDIQRGMLARRIGHAP